MSLSPDRQAVYSALFALASTVTWTAPAGAPTSFATVARQVKLFADVGQGQRPACFQAEHDETWAQVTGLPYKRIFGASWIIYTNAGRDAGGIPGADQVNAILTGIENALIPIGSQRQTLGGLVHHCFIDGRVFKDPGDIDGTGLIIVPFKILAP